MLLPGGGGEPGASEVAYIVDKEHWGQGIITDVLKTVVTQWRPHVRKGGEEGFLETGDLSPALLKQRWRCFGGDILKRFDATSSLPNRGSWRALEKNDFVRAQSGLSDHVIDLTNLDETLFGRLTSNENLKKFDDYIVRTYYAPGEEKIPVGTRCLLIDPEEKNWTISFHKDYKKIKVHVERPITTN